MAGGDLKSRRAVVDSTRNKFTTARLVSTLTKKRWHSGGIYRRVDRLRLPF
jgi:ribosomal protein L17